MRHIVKFITTFFYAGFFPKIPGTFASTLACGVYLLLKENTAILFMFTAFAVASGFLFCAEAEHILKKKDAPQIVIDEVAGMLLILCALPKEKISLFILFCVFLVFRLLDILKPYPIRRIQKLPGSFGVMLDDIAASFYTVVLFYVFFRLASWITS